MTINVDWTNNNRRCIYQQHLDEWSVEEFIQAHQQVLELRKSVPYPVHRIIDLLESTTPPPGFMKALKYVVRNHDIRNTTSVYINRSPANKLMINLYSQIYVGHLPHIYEVKSLEEAHAIIQKLESDLIDDSNYANKL